MRHFDFSNVLHSHQNLNLKFLAFSRLKDAV
jgi:hypothetical protein